MNKVRYMINVDATKVAKLMVDKYNFDPSKENMEMDRTNYSYALLDSLTYLYDLEGVIDIELEKLDRCITCND